MKVRIWALHSRTLAHTDLKRHAEEAMEQARLSERAKGAFGLSETVRVFGQDLLVELDGPAERVAAFVDDFRSRGTVFDHVGAISGEEHELLSLKLRGLAEVREC